MLSILFLYFVQNMHIKQALVYNILSLKNFGGLKKWVMTTMLSTTEK